MCVSPYFNYLGAFTVDFNLKPMASKVLTPLHWFTVTLVLCQKDKGNPKVTTEPTNLESFAYQTIKAQQSGTVTV